MEMTPGKVTAGISLATVLAGQFIGSNYPIAATVANLAISQLCVSFYSSAIKANHDQFSPGVGLIHAASFGLLTLLSGGRTLKNLYSAFEFGDTSHLLKGVGHAVLTSWAVNGIVTSVTEPQKAEESKKGWFQKIFG